MILVKYLVMVNLSIEKMWLELHENHFKMTLVRGWEKMLVLMVQ